MRGSVLLFAGFALGLCLLASASAEEAPRSRVISPGDSSAGGGFVVRRLTIDTGHAQTANGGGLEVRITSGQHDASTAMTGGGLRVRGGFWAAPTQAPGDNLFANGFE